jgi:uncharacterized protein YcbK (DUF882 family)
MSRSGHTSLHRPRLLTRRAALGALACGSAAAALLAGASARAAVLPAGPRRITLHNTHTVESLSVEYCRDGAYCGAALAAVNQVLRDHRNGAVHAIDPGLLDLLTDLAQRCTRDAEFEVISGYRSPESNAALHARWRPKRARLIGFADTAHPFRHQGSAEHALGRGTSRVGRQGGHRLGRVPGGHRH